MVRVTLRDCATNAPLGPAFSSLVTFHGDGTLGESAGSLAFAPGQRSPGHGTWTRKRGHTYRQEMIALVLFDTEPNLPGTATFDPTKPVSPGFFAGWQTVSHTVRFTAVDRIASTGPTASTRRTANCIGAAARQRPVTASRFIRGASPLGLPDTRSRAPLRRSRSNERKNAPTHGVQPALTFEWFLEQLGALPKPLEGEALANLFADHGMKVVGPALALL
jgi:hypothetical protein